MRQFHEKIEAALLEQQALDEGLGEFGKKVSDYVKNSFKAMLKDIGTPQDNFFQVDFNAGIGTKYGPKLSIKIAEDLKADGRPSDKFMEVNLTGFKAGPKLLKSEVRAEWVRGDQQIRDKIWREADVESPEALDIIISKLVGFVKELPIWSKLKKKAANFGGEKETEQTA